MNGNTLNQYYKQVHRSITEWIRSLFKFLICRKGEAWLADIIVHDWNKSKINCCYMQVQHYEGFTPWWTLWLTHWGRVTHICVSKQTIIGSDNGLSPGGRQAIIWTDAGILLIWPLGTNFSEILIEIHAFFHSRKCIWKCRLRNGVHFVSASICQQYEPDKVQYTNRKFIEIAIAQLS